MGLIVLVVACAVVLGWGFGGRLATLGDLPVRHWPLLMAALLVQVVGALAVPAGLPAEPVAVGSVLVSGALAVVFCVANRGAHGITLAGLGLLCNGLVICLNGAMPVSHHAADRAGMSWSTLRDDARHEPADARTLLRPLGDVVPVPLPGRPEVVSVGDLLVAAGVAQFVLSGMLRRAAPEPNRTGSRGGRRSRNAAGPGIPLRRRQRRSTSLKRMESLRHSHSGPLGERRQHVPRDRAGRPSRPYGGRGEIIEVESELVRVITRPRRDKAASGTTDPDPD